MNSLQSVAKFYLQEDLDKSRRDVFVTGTLEDVRQDFHTLVDYCASDVEFTHRVYRAVFPKFLAKKIQGNMVSFGGMLEMSSGILPISKRWHNYIKSAEEQLNQAQSHVTRKLQVLAEECLLRTDEAERQKDHYLKQLDFTPVGRKKLPKWYINSMTINFIEDIRIYIAS